MILDINEVKVQEINDKYIIGEAKKKTAVLKKNELVGMFDGLNTFLDYVQEKMPEAKRDKSSSDTSGMGHQGFSLGTYDNAMDTFRNNPQSLVNFQEGEMRIQDYNEQGNEVAYDVTGDFIDMSAVMEGIPEQFGSLHNGNTKNRRIRLVISLNNNWMTEPEDIIHRSERIIRLVDMLEANNIRTEIIGIYTSGCNHTEILMKRFDETLVLSDLAVMTNTDFQRRLMFRVTEYSKTYYHNYGDTSRINSMNLESDFNDELTILIPGNPQNKRTTDNMFDKLEKNIEEEMNEPITKTRVFKPSYGWGF